MPIRRFAALLLVAAGPAAAAPERLPAPRVAEPAVKFETITSGYKLYFSRAFAEKLLRTLDDGPKGEAVGDLVAGLGRDAADERIQAKLKLAGWMIGKQGPKFKKELKEKLGDGGAIVTVVGVEKPLLKDRPFVRDIIGAVRPGGREGHHRGGVEDGGHHPVDVARRVAEDRRRAEARPGPAGERPPQVRTIRMSHPLTALAAAAFAAACAAAPAPKPRPEEPPTFEQVKTSTNNLKQFGIAWHAYHGDYNGFPPNIRDKDGKALLSWRVQILPYVERQALYNEFKLDEPWDSEHNKPLIEKMPKLFAPVRGKAEAGHTFYQSFSGGGSVLSNEKRSIANITDGTSNTIVVVEAGTAVIWTKPDDIEYDPKKPVPKVGGMFNGHFHALYADGSVRFLDRAIKEADLRAFITVAGGEVVGDFAEAPKPEK